MADINAVLEAERRGILPPARQSALDEARRRGLVPTQQDPRGIPSPTREEEFGVIQEEQAPGLGEALISGAKAFPGGVTQVASQAITALLSPVETAESIGMAAKGLYSKITGDDDPEEAIIDAIVQDYKDTYGTFDKLKFAIAERPERLLGDLSLVLSGGASAASGITKAAGLTRTANALRKVAAFGRAVDPLRLPFTLAKPVTKLITKLNKKLIGNVLTGAGEEFTEQAFRPGPGKDRFLSALRGDEPLENFLDESRGALDAVRAERATNYVDKLKDVKRSTAILDFKPIRKAFEDKLDDFRIRIDTTVPGGLDFSDSVISNARDIRTVRGVANDIFRWTKNPDNLTPIGMDTLKRRLDDRFVFKGATKSIVTDLRNKVKNTIVAAVPEYRAMTKEYQELTKLIHNIEDALSLGKNAKAQTAIGKLSSLLRENKEFSKQMIEQMAAVGGKDIIPIAAGLAAKPLTASATIGRRTQEAAVIIGLMGGFDPKLAIGALVSSPRVVAEFLNVLGKGARAFQKAQKAVGISIPATFGKLGGLRTIQQQPQLSPLEQTPTRKK